LAIGCALVVALLAMPLTAFTILGSVDSSENASSNAVTWNATLNGTMSGISILPIIVIVIVAFVCLGLMATARGF